MKKIKILHITQPTIAGTHTFLKLLFKYIDKEKFEVELVCPSYGPMKEDIESLGFKVYVVEMKREINPVNDISSYIKLKRIIKIVKPDIVHCHCSKAGVLGRLAAYENKTLCVYTAHGWSFSMDENNIKKKIYSSVERICSKYCNFIVNISEFEQNLALKYKIAPKSKMVTINNGIELKNNNSDVDSDKVLDELNIPRGSYIIGMVARLTKQKSPETFIKIADILTNKIPNSYFILVGDGELKEEIFELIKEKKLIDRVKIIGWTDEVNKYISVFDVGILTSKWEGFGLVLPEYMACRKPIVASNVGGIRNVVINGHNGILVDSDDIDGFVNSILSLKNNNEFKNILINNAFEDMNNKFNIKRVVSEYEILYKKIINKSGN